MCGRYTLTTPPEALRSVFGLEGPLPNFPPRYNIAPTQPVPLVHKDTEGRGALTLSFMRWGLVPHWSKGPDNRFSMINARSETLEEKPAYRGPFRYRRCVLPADGFYEWKAMSRGPKQPYLLRRADGKPFFMAGVWDRWLGPDGSEIDSVSIVTRPAVPDIQDIHDRMPLILDRDEAQGWLSAEGGIKGLRSILQGSVDITLERVAVSRMINDVRCDEPTCLKPVEE